MDELRYISNLQRKTTLEFNSLFESDMSCIHSENGAQNVDFIHLPHASISDDYGSNDRVIPSFLNCERANRDIFEAAPIEIEKKILIVDDQHFNI